VAQPKEESFGGTGRPFERGAADGVQAVVRRLVVLDDFGWWNQLTVLES
jgi:hypothetical protein